MARDEPSHQDLHCLQGHQFGSARLNVLNTCMFCLMHIAEESEVSPKRGILRRVEEEVITSMKMGNMSIRRNSVKRKVRLLFSVCCWFVVVCFCMPPPFEECVGPVRPSVFCMKFFKRGHQCPLDTFLVLFYAVLVVDSCLLLLLLFFFFCFVFCFRCLFVYFHLFIYLFIVILPYLHVLFIFLLYLAKYKCSCSIRFAYIIIIVSENNIFICHLVPIFTTA